LNYLIAALPDTSNKIFNQQKVRRYLIVEEQNLKVTQGYIYEILATDNDFATHEQELLKGFANIKISNNFGGNLSKFMINGIILESTEYINGKLNAYKRLYTRQANTNKVILGLKKTINSCSDWYLVTYYTDGSEVWTYLGRTCICSQTNSIRNSKGLLSVKLLCDQGGSPPSDTPCVPQSQSIKNGKLIFVVSDPPCAPVDSPKVVHIALCNDFTVAEKNDFQTEYGYIINGNCLQQSLITALGATGKHISICKGTVPAGANASSDPDGDITWRDGLAFYTDMLSEEFFHEVQFSAYIGRTLSNVNIEFEASILRDMINGTSDALQNTGLQDRTDYTNWLKSITNNYTSFPQSITDIMPDNNAKEQYFHMMDLYNSQYDASSTHHGTVDRNFNPLALFEVTKNCK
jgi:hypothetical protein